MTEQKVQDDAVDKFRKNDKFTKKSKGTNNTGKETLEVEDDETESAADGDDLKSLVYTSNSFVDIRDKQQNVVQAKCYSECTGKSCGTTVDFFPIHRILCIGAMVDPHFKTIKDTSPEFTEYARYGVSI